MKTLRLFLVIAAMSALPWSVTIQRGSFVPAQQVALAAPPEGAPAPQAAPDVDIKVEGGDRHVVWSVSPVMIAAGIAAALIIVALIAMAGRGGGTTIIREK